MSASTNLVLFGSVILLSTIPIITERLVDDEFEDASSVTLLHSFDSGPSAEFTRRGSISLRSLKTGKSHAVQDEGLSYNEKEQLRKLAEENGLYRIRVPIRAANRAIQYVSSFTLACGLYESRLSDHISVSVDQSGDVIGVSIGAWPGVCTGADVDLSNLDSFNTTVEIVQALPGVLPDTQSYIDKMKHEEKKKVKGQEEDNRSFFAKYWMYIVPVVVILLLVQGQDSGGGGGGGGG